MRVTCWVDPNKTGTINSVQEFISPDIPVIDSPELARLYDTVYERKLAIHQASTEPNSDVNPSTFTCSGGASLYFEQPIDQAKRQELRQLYLASLLARQAVASTATLSPTDIFRSQQLEWELSNRISYLDNTEYRRPLDDTAWGTIPQFLQDAAGTGRYAMRSNDDFEHALCRMYGFADWAKVAVENMREGIQEADTLPQALGARVLRNMDTYLEDSGRALRDIFSQPLRAANVDERFKQTYTDAANATAIATYASLAEFMRHEYMPHCLSDDKLGLRHIPDGQEQYRRLIRYHTSSDASVEEVAAIAEESYWQSLGELKRLAQELEFGSVDELGAVLLDDTAPHDVVRPFTDVGQIMDRYMSIAERIDLGSSKIFLPQDKPGDNWRLLPVTDHTATTDPPTYTNGTFRVPIESVTRYNAANMHMHFLHEVVPGHHAQIGLLARMKLPKFLQHSTRHNAVREGWAMYAETLADEVGAPYSNWEYAAKLTFDLTTAALSIADIGIHHEGWSLQKARRYASERIPGYHQTKENLFLTRMVAWPAQVHAYTYGATLLRDMRAATHMQMGNKFDVRVFHNAVLRAGEMPAAILKDFIFYKMNEAMN